MRKSRNYLVLGITIILTLCMTTVAFAAEVDQGALNAEKFGILTIIPPFISRPLECRYNTSSFGYWRSY